MWRERGRAALITLLLPKILYAEAKKAGGTPGV